MSQKPRDVDKKTGIDGAGYFGAAGYFFGWDGDSFPFYSGPMLSHVPKSKGCRQKDSKLGIFVESFPFDSGPMLSHVPKLKDFFQAGYLGVSTKLGILGQLGILE